MWFISLNWKGRGTLGNHLLQNSIFCIIHIYVLLQGGKREVLPWSCVRVALRKCGMNLEST